MKHRKRNAINRDVHAATGLSVYPNLPVTAQQKKLALLELSEGAFDPLVDFVSVFEQPCLFGPYVLVGW